jgi:hypothetical protein
MRRGHRGTEKLLQKRALPGQISAHGANTAGFSPYGKRRRAALC